MASQNPVKPKEKRILEIMLEIQSNLSVEDKKNRAEMIQGFGAEFVKNQDRVMAEMQYEAEQKRKPAAKAAPKPLAAPQIQANDDASYAAALALQAQEDEKGKKDDKKRHAEDDERYARELLAKEEARETARRRAEEENETAARRLQENEYAVKPSGGLAVSAPFLTQFNHLRLQENGTDAYIRQHDEKENAEMCKVDQKRQALLDKDAKALQKMQEELAQILKSPSVTHANVDAHTYTRSHISKEYLIILATDKALNLSDNPAFAETEKSMRAFLNKIKTASKEIDRFNPGYFEQELKNIKAKPGVDNETGVNVTEMINRAWSLATLLDYHHKMGSDLPLFMRTGMIDKNKNKGALDGGFRAIILQSLSDNILDKGGCIPGVIARLHPIYLNMVNIFVNDTLNHKRSGQQPAPNRIAAVFK